MAGVIEAGGGEFTREIVAMLGGGGVGAALTRAWLGSRRIDRVDAVTAIAAAFEKAQQATERHVEALSLTIAEQGKRIDALETLVVEKDRALGERDRTIRRLRDIVELHREALVAAGVDPPGPRGPIAPHVAPDRRSPTVHDVADVVAEATTIAATTKPQG